MAQPEAPSPPALAACAGMRVAIVTEMGAWSASTRYRALQHVPRLQDLFEVVDVFAPDDRPRAPSSAADRVRYFGSHAQRYVARRRELANALKSYDAVLVQRGAYPMGPSWVSDPLVDFSGRLVLDLDDDVFSVKPALANRGHLTQTLYGPQQTRALASRADAVIVSTPTLASALPAAVTGDVHVLPTMPDPTAFEARPEPGGQPVIGWAGTTGGLGYLDPLRSVFAELAAGGVASTSVVCSQAWAGPARFVPWSLERETSDLSDFSVGIMPLPDTPFTRAKAGFKLLQYMAAGRAVVASPVGVNVELVESSGAGRLALSARDWERELRALCTAPDVRRAHGEAGRAFVERRADMQGQVRLLSSLLAGVPVAEKEVCP